MDISKLNKNGSEYFNNIYSKLDNVESKRMYTMGAEVEFFIYEGKDNSAYDKRISREYTATEYFFGFDGAGSGTKEFRSPIFMSKNPVKCFNNLVNFIEVTQDYLTKTYSAVFIPWEIDVDKPAGIHFSIGGEYLDNWRELMEVLHRIEFMSKEINKYFDPVSSFNSLFTRREHQYHSDFEGNGLKINERRLEIRMFPSCFIDNITPILKYILFGEDIPEHHLFRAFIKNKDYDKNNDDRKKNKLYVPFIGGHI